MRRRLLISILWIVAFGTRSKVGDVSTPRN